MAKRGRPSTQQSSADQVADRLRLAIAAYLPGSRLPVTEELADQFRVSLHAVRLALGQLTNEGLIESRPRQGFFVTNRSKRVPALREIHVITPQAEGFRPTSQHVLLGIDRQCRRYRIPQKNAEVEHPGQVTTALLDRLRGRRSPLEVGWAFVYVLPPEQELMAWRLRGLRFLLVDVESPTQPVSYVRADKQGAMYTATEQLIRLGHHRIAMIGTLATDQVLHRERRRGYDLAMRRHGLAISEDLLLAEPFGEYRGMLRELPPMLSGPNAPTAIVATNQRMGVELIEACEALGYDVPGQISIASIGFRRLELAERVDRLSRCDEGPAEELGHLAVDALLEVPRSQRPVRLLGRYRWIDRGSVGPPANIPQL